MVQDLEARHQKVRQQYEEEIQALRAELQALRSAPPPTPPAAQVPPSQLGLSLPPGAQGHPGNGGPMPGIERTGPGGYQGELYDRDRDRERDRDDRGRD